MKKESGMALVSALIMLLIITSLSVTTIQMAVLEQRSAATFEDKVTSGSAAQSALTSAKTWILAQTTPPSTIQTCSSVPCLSAGDYNTDLSTKSSTWWQANSVAYANSLFHVTTPPRYVIESVRVVNGSSCIGNSGGGVGEGSCNDNANNNNNGSGNTNDGTGGSTTSTYYYRITARGTGTSDNSVTFMQSYVTKTY